MLFFVQVICSQRKDFASRSPTVLYIVQMFILHATTPTGRCGTLSTAHGPIETPFFMPVGTAGAMRGITHDDLLQLGAQILLCNTYHLHLQPGEDIIHKAGGLHQFIHWSKPILTDSGGFQVFSLRHQLTIEEHGVHFRSHIDGSPLFIGPREAMEIQHKLGSDIIMCFDECPPSTSPKEEIRKAVDRTLRWAKECKRAHQRLSVPSPRGESLPAGRQGLGRGAPLLFAIIQGGLDPSLRKFCAEELIAMDFDGYALGGLAVGETEEEMYGILDAVCPILPKDKPRYLMGVGRIHQLKECVRKGIDMFDCVLPMREARHGTLYLSDGSTIRILNAKFKNDHTPIDPTSPSPLSHTHLKSYLAHLFRTKERLAETIACMQNLGMVLRTMQEMRREMKTQNINMSC